jgi:hypothetical protein
MKYIKQLVIARKIKPFEMVMSITDLVIDGFLAMMIVLILIATISWIANHF